MFNRWYGYLPSTHDISEMQKDLHFSASVYVGFVLFEQKKAHLHTAGVPQDWHKYHTALSWTSWVAATTRTCMPCQHPAGGVVTLSQLHYSGTNDVDIVWTLFVSHDQWLENGVHQTDSEVQKFIYAQ